MKKRCASLAGICTIDKKNSRRLRFYLKTCCRNSRMITGYKQLLGNQGSSRHNKLHDNLVKAQRENLMTAQHHHNLTIRQSHGKAAGKINFPVPGPSNSKVYPEIRSSASCPGFPEKRFSDHIPGNGRFFRVGKSSPDALRRVIITSSNAATLKRFERSEATERLERLERIDPGGFVLAGIKPVSSP